MIPARAQFIWIGRDFPWLNWAAIATAQKQGGFERLVLHHTDDLSGSEHARALERLPKVELNRLSVAGVELLLERSAGPRLVDLYRVLQAPAARANVLRIALLRCEGGVYLDLDTVTCRSLSTLRAETGFFCGTERLAFPGSLRGSLNPARWAQAYARSAVRDVLRRSAHGVAAFRSIESYYPAAANNAVLGAQPKHPLLDAMLERMLSLPRERALRRFALGTGLLQAALADYSGTDVRVHAPESFYPLGPEISEHWFREDSRAKLDEVVTQSTRVVHWYASVRTRKIVPNFDPSWMDRHPKALLCQLLARTLQEPTGAAGVR